MLTNLILDFTSYADDFNDELSSFYEARYMFDDLLSKAIYSYKTGDKIMEYWDDPSDDLVFSRLMNKAYDLIESTCLLLKINPLQIERYSSDNNGTVCIQIRKGLTP